IAVAVHGGLEQRSGGYLYDRKLVEYLRACGDQVEVIGLPQRSYGWSMLQNLHPGLRRRLRQLQCDVLLEDALTHPALFALNGWLAARTGYRRVGLVHHLRCDEALQEPAALLARQLERRFLEG